MLVIDPPELITYTNTFIFDEFIEDGSDNTNLLEV